jgi:hypothetical protein
LSAGLLAEQRDEEGGESQEEGGDGRREGIALSSRRIVRTEQRLAHRSFAGEDVRDPCFQVSLVNRLGRLPPDSLAGAIAPFNTAFRMSPPFASYACARARKGVRRVLDRGWGAAL